MRKSLLLLLFVSLLVLVACNDLQEKTQSLEQFYKDAKIEKVHKIIIRDGSTGYLKTIVEQEKIDEFLALIKDIVFTPQDNQEERVGWRYAITLIDGEKEFKFSLNHINDTYYDSKPDIHPIVENYYKQLDVEEE